MKRFTSVFVASLIGMGLLAGCGAEGRHQVRNRGDVRILVPEATDSSRSAIWDFGEVVTGKSKSVTLRLRNVGPDGVIVTATRFENAPSGAFFAQPPSIIAGDNGEADLTLTFSPPSAGDYAGQLIIEHSGESLSASVSLSGKGT